MNTKGYAIYGLDCFFEGEWYNAGSMCFLAYDVASYIISRGVLLNHRVHYLSDYEIRHEELYRTRPYDISFSVSAENECFFVNIDEFTKYKKTTYSIVVIRADYDDIIIGAVQYSMSSHSFLHLTDDEYNEIYRVFRILLDTGIIYYNTMFTSLSEIDIDRFYTRQALATTYETLGIEVFEKCAYGLIKGTHQLRYWTPCLFRDNDKYLGKSDEEIIESEKKLGEAYPYIFQPNASENDDDFFNPDCKLPF
ncbi:MAG: hypothetical protein QXH07_07025 [Thermoplasmata archaeon]